MSGMATTALAASAAAPTPTMDVRARALSRDSFSYCREIARTQARSLGGTDNYRVTREFRRISSREQRVQLLECLHAVAAADGSISTAESRAILSIAEELGLRRPDVNAVRTSWRQHLAELQGLPTQRS